MKIALAALGLAHTCHGMMGGCKTKTQTVTAPFRNVRMNPEAPKVRRSNENTSSDSLRASDSPEMVSRKKRKQRRKYSRDGSRDRTRRTRGPGHRLSGDNADTPRRARKIPGMIERAAGAPPPPPPSGPGANQEAPQPFRMPIRSTSPPPRESWYHDRNMRLDHHMPRRDPNGGNPNPGPGDCGPDGDFYFAPNHKGEMLPMYLDLRKVANAPGDPEDNDWTDIDGSRICEQRADSKPINREAYFVKTDRFTGKYGNLYKAGEIMPLVLTGFTRAGEQMPAKVIGYNPNNGRYLVEFKDIAGKWREGTVHYKNVNGNWKFNSDERKKAASELILGQERAAFEARAKQLHIHKMKVQRDHEFAIQTHKDDVARASRAAYDRIRPRGDGNDRRRLLSEAEREVDRISKKNRLIEYHA